MKFNLLRKDIIVNINKRIRIALVTFFIGVVLLLLASLMKNSFGIFLGDNFFIILIAFTILDACYNIFMLYHKASRDPSLMLEITDMSIILKSKYNEVEEKLLGLVYVELDLKTYKPAMTVKFIYSENKVIDVMMNMKEYEDLVRCLGELNIKYEEAK